VGRRKTRQLYCTTFSKRFVETKGTVFYRARMVHEKVISILQPVQEGDGMRQTGRLTHVKEDTMIRLDAPGRQARPFGASAKAGLFPLGPRNCNWMRSGPLSTRSRSNATWRIRKITPPATAGITWLLIPSIAWYWGWSSANAAPPGSRVFSKPRRKRHQRNIRHCDTGRQRATSIC